MSAARLSSRGVGGTRPKSQRVRIANNSNTGGGGGFSSERRMSRVAKPEAGGQQSVAAAGGTKTLKEAATGVRAAKAFSSGGAARAKARLN